MMYTMYTVYFIIVSICIYIVVLYSETVWMLNRLLRCDMSPLLEGDNLQS